MRRGFGELAHANRLKRRVDARNHLFAGNAKVLQPKRDILPNDGRDKLIIGILENHPCLLADFPEILVALGIHAADGDMPFCGQIEGIEELCEGGFTGAVMAEDGEKFAFVDLQGDMVESGFRGILIGEGNVLNVDAYIHDDNSFSGWKVKPGFILALIR